AERGRRPFDLASLVRLGAEHRIPITPTDLYDIVHPLPRVECEFLCPKSVHDFVRLFVAGSGPASILDPWAGFGTLLAGVTETTKAERVCGINQVVSAFETAQLLDPAKKIDWQLGDPLEILDKLDETFDLVVSNLPFGATPGALLFETDAGPIEIRDSFGHLV